MVTIQEKKKYQAYYTKSRPIVKYMVDKLSIQPMDKIFEPCGGDGELVEGILKLNNSARIDICELNPYSVELLNKKFSDYLNVSVWECDILLDLDLNLKTGFGGFYDKIIANPPYGAWHDSEKKAILKNTFPGVYIKESYALFLFRCIDLLKEGGMLSFIIPDTFLNLHMHKALREKLLTRTKIIELALFPSSFFPGVNFGYANLCIISLQKTSAKKDCLNNIFRVLTDFSTVEQLNYYDKAKLKVYDFAQEEILSNPDYAFFISENSKISKIIKHSTTYIGDIAKCVTGFYSGDDKTFLKVLRHNLKNGKNYGLIVNEKINTTYQHSNDILDGIEAEDCFLPIVKGGNVKYFKPDVWFMDWSKESVKHFKKDKKARFQNPSYYFKMGVGVPMISASSITAALIENKLFDQSIVGVFPKDENLTYYLLAFFNSPTCNQLIRTINPSANNPANYIKKIPFIEPNKAVLIDVTEKTSAIVESIKRTGQYDLQVEKEVHTLIKELYGF